MLNRDHVQWTDEETEQARQRAEENSSPRIPVEEQGKNAVIKNTFCLLDLDSFNLLHVSSFDPPPPLTPPPATTFPHKNPTDSFQFIGHFYAGHLM